MADPTPPVDPLSLVHAAVDAIARGWGMFETFYLWVATGTGAAAVLTRAAWIRYRAGRDVTAEVAKLEGRLAKIEASFATLSAEVTSAKSACEIATGGVAALAETIKANAAQSIRERAEIITLLTTLIASNNH